MFRDIWEGDDTKHIINISSDITDRNPKCHLLDPEVKTYWFAKTVLNEKSNNVTHVTQLKDRNI